MNTELAQMIKTHFPFREEALIQELIEIGKPIHLKKGEQVLRSGEFIKTIPLLFSGSLKIMRQDESGDELLMFYLSSGNACAMSFICCMIEEKSAIKALAEEDSEILLIPTRYMDIWMSKYKSWRDFVLNAYKHRFVGFLDTIDNLAFKNMELRLKDYLKEKASIRGSKQLDITHQEIAYDLNTSREVISRTLKKMEKEGILKLSRNSIELLFV